MLCGKQGLPLRGHRDDGVDFEHVSADSNQGNFLELVHFRSETDEVLASHLKHAPRNALYTSKTIQNSLIEVVRQCMLKDIISEVKKKHDTIPSLRTRLQISLTRSSFHLLSGMF